MSPNSRSVTSWPAFKKQASAVQDCKDNLTLFNSSVFEPPLGAEGYRRQDYFKQSSFLVLDFDNGELSPERFVEIFWSKAGRGQKRSFLICNSFSRSLQQPNRFRVIMFYKRPATSIGQHKAILDDVIRRLEANGFPDGSHGLDPNCKSGIQSFYLPCTNRDHRKSAIFRDFGLKTRELERCAIDPADYLLAAPGPSLVPNAAHGPIVLSAAIRERIDAATAELRSLKAGRHQAVFETAMALARFGLSEAEVRGELLQAVGHEANDAQEGR